MENILYLILFITLFVMCIKFKAKTILTIASVVAVAYFAGFAVLCYDKGMEKLAAKVKGNVDEDVAVINKDAGYTIDTTNALTTDEEIQAAIALENFKENY